MSAESRVRPRSARSARSDVLVRRGHVCDYEGGERPIPSPDRVLRLGRPALLPITSVACVAVDEPVVALTYDDGPDPGSTPGILAALAAHEARATFFVLVEAAEKHPDLVRRMLAAGHEVALHGIDHTRLNRLPLRRAVRLIREGKQRLEQVTGAPVTIFRPTYGAQTLPQYVLTRALGLEVVIWSAWARDWDGSPAAVVADRALGALHHGGFVLLHDASGDGVGAGPVTEGVTEGVDAGVGEGDGLDRVEATRLLLAGMSARGYSSRTVSDLLSNHPAVRTLWASRH